MTIISATIIADSIGEHAPRLTTMLLCYPRWIHAEGRTHRVVRIGEDMEIEVRTPSLMEDPNLSRNASSARAIPVNKMIKDVIDAPAVPLFWGKNQKGMQGGEEHDARVRVLSTDFGGSDRRDADWTMSNVSAWLTARDHAVSMAMRFAEAGYHKQIVNRLLEPFSHIRVVVSASEWSNFYALRRHADAEPHIKLLADRMWAAMEASTPRLLQPGEWHLPFVNEADMLSIGDYRRGLDTPEDYFAEACGDDTIKLSVARCASTSYRTVDGFDMTPDRAVDLHDKLVASTPLHASPCEHQARVDEIDEGWPADETRNPKAWAYPELRGNFAPGWIQYRKTLAGESV